MFISLVMVVKNEEAVLARALESFQPPNRFWDEMVITDTGSADATISIARRHGARVVEAPWPGGFGAARNLAASNASPQADLVVNFDGDEVLGRGGDRLRALLEEGHSRGKRLFGLRYEWSHDATGAADLVFSRQVIYDPRLYRWAGRVHESLQGPLTVDRMQHLEEVTLEHWPKPQDHGAKSLRDLALLEMDAREAPENPRTLFYLGREYSHQKRHSDTIATLDRYLKVATWKPERMGALHLMAAAADALGDDSAALAHLMRAVTEQPERREPYLELCRRAYKRRLWRECTIWGEAVCAIPNSAEPQEYFRPRDVYTWLPHDYLAVAYWNLGDHQRGSQHLEQAIAFRPNDPRLLANRQWFSGTASPNKENTTDA